MDFMKMMVRYIVCVVCLCVSQVALGFNGDLFADLIIGVPNEDLDAVENSGGLHALYSTSSGLTAEGSQYWTQTDLYSADPQEEDDKFAYSIVSGDFNGDTYSDLAVGVPWESTDALEYSGVVQVIYGSSQGFQTTNPAPDYFSQDTQGIPGVPEEHDGFGWALASGDFNHDGFDDLAIGAPGEAIGDLTFSGAVWIIPGSSTGLITPDVQYYEQNDLGSENPTEEGDQFGEALSTGDINGDGYADLVIGSSGESIDEVDSSQGCIHVMYGSASGLSTTGAHCFWQGRNSEIPGVPEEYDNFGDVITTGDFNSDGYDDIVVSAWGEDIQDAGANAGIVHVFWGTASGATTAGNMSMSPGSENDKFGQSLASGDVNGDGFMDLIVGSPGCDFISISGAGSICTYLGSSEGLDPSSCSKMYQEDSGLTVISEEGDDFGSSIVSADFDGDGFWDVAVAAKCKIVDSVENAGAVIILRGSGAGLTATGAQFWSQNSDNVHGDAEQSDFFGSSLAVSKTRSQPSTCTETGVSIEMPGTLFHPGDSCGCTVTVCNAESTSIANPLFVILDVAGSYYFAPTFSAYDNYFTQIPNFAPGSMTVTVLPPFTWPAGTGSFSGCTWYAALTDPNVTHLVGVMDSWTFGWSE